MTVAKQTSRIKPVLLNIAVAISDCCFIKCVVSINLLIKSMSFSFSEAVLFLSKSFKAIVDKQ